MASRLSADSMLASTDRGLSASGWQPDNLPTGAEEERSARNYLNSLLQSKDPVMAVGQVEPSLIRHVIIASGVEDHLEVLPLLTRDQMTHIVDFEGWHDGQINPVQTARWLQLHRQAKPGELFRRFADLEEEFQLGLLGPLIEIFDLEAFEELPQTEQDQLRRLPCGEVFYKIKSEDEEVCRFIETLMEEALTADIQYAYSLLAHAAYLPPAEQEALAHQFREARMEEEGFVSPSEAAKVFIATNAEATVLQWTGLDVKTCLERIQKSALTTTNTGALKTIDFDGQPRLSSIEHAMTACDPETASQFVTGLSHLANTLAVAAGLDPDNRNGLRLILAHTKGYCNLGLEILGEGTADAGKLSQIIAKEHPATLFKVSVAICDQIRQNTIRTLEQQSALSPAAAHRLQQLLFSRKFGQILHQLDQDLLPSAGVEVTEIVKGLCNRFPVHPTLDSSQQKMTFRPVHDLSGLRQLLSWTQKLESLTPEMKH